MEKYWVGPVGESLTCIHWQEEIFISAGVGPVGESFPCADMEQS
jgi:hypothetical protein